MRRRVGSASVSKTSNCIDMYMYHHAYLGVKIDAPTAVTDGTRRTGHPEVGRRILAARA
jgi:hypothetical protein